MDNSFKNSFPIENKPENKTPEKIGPPEKSKKSGISGKNLSVLNIGQILVLVILFIVICLQAVNILFPAVQNIPAEPLPGISGGQPDVLGGSDYPGGAAAEPAAEVIPAAEPEILFILGESGGRLAVLSPDRQTVYETFSVYISTLPEYDRTLLLEGIKIKTAEELASLLEDYNS